MATATMMTDGIKKEEVKELECAWCEDTMRGETFEAQDGLICDDCYADHSFTCDDCDNIHHSDNSRSILNIGETICDNCYDNGDYFFCVRCEEYLTNAENNGRDICHGCDEDEDREEIVSRVDIKYRPIDLKTKDFQSDDQGSIITSPRLFGVELEMVHKDAQNLAKLSQTLDKKIGVTRDGSIQGGHGLEIQTPILKGKTGENTILDILSKVKDSKMVVNNTCGTHCHLDAKDFIPETYKECRSYTGKVDGEMDLYAWFHCQENEFDRQVSDYIPQGQWYRINGVEYDEKYTQPMISLDERGGLCESKSFGYKADDIEYALVQFNHNFGIPFDRTGGKIRFRGVKKNTFLIMVEDDHILPTRDVNYRIMLGTEIDPKGKFRGLYHKSVFTSKHIRNLKALTAFYLTYDDVFLSMLPTTRRDNTFCKPIKSRYTLRDILGIQSQGDFDKMWFRHEGDPRGTNGGRDNKEYADRKLDPHDSSRYVGVNFHSLLSRNGTLEIRYHSGTLDSQKILYWVALHQRIMDLASSGGLDIKLIEKSHNKIRFEEKLKDFFSILKLPSNLQTYVEGRINTYNK